tara:strand:- start:9057 stop:9575 length:519 start_codon:yes stop_codon:yes gene_type:complete
LLFGKDQLRPQDFALDAFGNIFVNEEGAYSGPKLSKIDKDTNIVNGYLGKYYRHFNSSNESFQAQYPERGVVPSPSADFVIAQSVQMYFLDSQGNIRTLPTVAMSGQLWPHNQALPTYSTPNTSLTGLHIDANGKLYGISDQIVYSIDANGYSQIVPPLTACQLATGPVAGC